jgi:hypothetical protein
VHRGQGVLCIILICECNCVTNEIFIWASAWINCDGSAKSLGDGPVMARPTALGMGQRKA